MYSKIIIAVIIITQAFFGFYMYHMNQSLQQQNATLSESFVKINANTNGKVEALKSDLTKQIATVQNKSTETQTVTYVQKDVDQATGVKEDTDVELKTKPTSITVKVNDGKKYDFQYLPKEKSKFENGKLVVESQTKTLLDIRAPEPKPSRYTVMALSDADKNVKGGVFYNFNNTVSAGVMFGQGIKPHYGVLLKVGGHR